MRARNRGWLLAGVLSIVMIIGSGVPAFAAPSGSAQSVEDGGLWDSILGLFGGSNAPAPKEPPKSVDLKLDGVPHDDPGTKGKAWATPKRVKELTSRRTANAKFYQLSDGRVQAEYSQTPVHYRDANGVWKPIDLTVRADGQGGFKVANTSNAFTSRFGDKSDRLVRFESGGRHIELGLAGPASAVTPAVDGSTVTYGGAASGADVVYEVTPTTLQEDFVLEKAPAAGFSVTLTLKTGGLVAQQLGDGSIAFTGRDGGRVVFVMPAPYMFDAKDDAKSDVGKVMSRQVAQTLTQHASTAEITITPDAGWLADPARVYPVTIDPTIKIQPVPSDGQDVEIYSGATGTNYNNTYQLKVGTESTNMWRSLVKFPLTGIPAGTPIDDAQLQLYYSQTHWDWSYDVALEARRVTTGWSESSATWANMNANIAAQPAGNMITVDDGDAGTSLSGTWPYSTNGTLTPKAVNGDYRYNSDTTAGNTHTWTPTITEAGDYQVEVHFTSESDRSTATPYTVYYQGGLKAYSVDQTGTANGIWKTLGVHPFAAGTTGKVVLGDVVGKSVIADAVRFTKWGATTKKRGISSVWNSFAVRNVVQDWVNGTQPNYGFMVKAVDEADKGRGGPVYEASEYAYDNNRRDYNLPKLVVTFGRKGVDVSPPTTITATGAALTWPAYVDPSTATGDDIVEYQVHRSVYQTFTPLAATLVAPVGKTSLAYQDTTAVPTPTDETDPLKRHFYYYMVAVKTADGQVIAGPTQGVLLPKAGRITKIFRETSANQVPDTTLAAGQPTANVNVYDGDPYVSPGNNSSLYGDTRGLVKFANLAGVPAGAQVVDAQLEMWNTYLYPGTVTDGKVDVHKLTRAFDETTATWTKANSTTNWTTPGGDYDPTAESYFDGFTNDPEWESWSVTNTVKSWLASPASNYGFLLKLRDEAVSTQRAMLPSSEGAEPMLRPTLQVTYLEPTAASTYFAPYTPARMIPGDTTTVTVSVSNPTTTTWAAANWELSYHWTLPDGTDATTGGNQAATALPRDILAGATADVAATLKAPIQSDSGNKRSDYVLKWELHNKITGQWLSAVAGIAALGQNVTVEDPTSNQLGLEKFYSYAGKNTGAGGSLMNNLYAGNTVWSLNAISNPSRGLSTFVRMAYNSQDTSDTVAGYGWSLQASSMMRLGTPLDFHPNPNPTTVTFTDGDGTAHTFSWDATANEWKSPAGVHLFLQRVVVCDRQTEQDRAWTLTRPDRTVFFYDCDGYLSSIEDNNGNLMTFTYEVRQSQNKPIKFLRYITDATGRQTLTITYWAKGDTFDYINDTTWTKVTGQTNLTNPKIVDHVRNITDISGRTLNFTYTDKGLLGELIDGVGSSQPKVFGFQYDMTQGNKNVKLVKVVDPRGHATNIAYYDLPDDDPKFKWSTKTYTDRLGYSTSFAYTDPDGAAGSTISAAVTDGENHTTTQLMDGFGRSTQTSNAKSQITKMAWDADNNVIRLDEANGAVSTWAYDPKTGYPTEVKDAEAVKNGWPGTTLAYQTGLNGHLADLIAKQSPEGRRWSFGYDTEGDLTSVTDPIGNTTMATGDYTTTYTYDTWGQMLTARDANGNTTTYGSFDPHGYPQTITDALNHASTFVYDIRGNVAKVTDPLGKDTTQTYDTFGRPLVNTVPKDQAAGLYVTTPAPSYDANDNITAGVAPNGAVTTAAYDDADQLSFILDPVDVVGDPQRKTTYTYDRVGNLLTTTEPKGNLTATAGDFVTTNGYDEINELTSVVNPIGGKVTYSYDQVGNVQELVDARKNATADPADYTLKLEYNLVHRTTKATDPLGKFTTSSYDRDGVVTATTDKLGNTAYATADARGKPVEVKVPHVDAGGLQYRITRTEYDQVGNVTKTINPRGVATTDDPDDFAQVTVYDELNRPKERRSAYDKDDTRYTTPDSTYYTYDPAGRLAKVSAPASEGQTVRNDTTYGYFDNGWAKTSTDPWDIVTRYDYDGNGQQTLRTVTSAGGSSDRTMTWQYHPDGNLKSRSDDGVPVGKQVVVVDDSDSQNVTATGTWAVSTTGAGLYGYDFRTHEAGTGSSVFGWRLNVPQAGTYEVFVRAPQVSGAATDAKFTIEHATGSVTKTVDQTAGAGTWISLGSYAFAEGSTKKITLTDQAGGTVIADAVKLVRANAGETDTEKHDFGYSYDPNGNLSSVTDASPNAVADSYLVTYTSANQVESVVEKLGSTVKGTASFTYDENGAPLTQSHDKAYNAFTYDVRDLLVKVVNGKSATDLNPKVTTFSYTDRGERLREVKGNGNTVDYSYFLDGLLKTQTEKKAGGTLVSDDTVDYDLDGNRSRDTTKKMNADNHGAYLSSTVDRTYDPQDRIATTVTTGAGAGSETYVHDANSNVISQTVNGLTTTSTFDRNRLIMAFASGVTSNYTYDPFGRLSAVDVNGITVQRNVYDGFDHVVENRSSDGVTTSTTDYTFDPMDRTSSKITNVGTPQQKTTTFHYLGLSAQLLDEATPGGDAKSYQYSPWGERLSQTTTTATGGQDDGYYGYNPHADVEQVTDGSGDTKATYGYTAYGSNDDSQFTGIDKPGTADPTKEPYNAYRFNAMRWDQNSSTYDMGFRDYSPGLNQFLTRDSYNGALADMQLSVDPWTGNRYAFCGGNPVSSIEIDGHDFWRNLNDFVTGFKDGWNNAGTDTANGIIAFVDDPMGAIDGLIAEKNKWQAKYGNEQTGWTCALTGICQIIDDLSNGNYYEAGYGTGNFAVSATLAFAVATAAEAIVARVVTVLSRTAEVAAEVAKSSTFITRGAGLDLIRTAAKGPRTYEFKTGHGYYRPHKGPNGLTDLRSTSLTPNQIEEAIMNDLEAFQSGGGTVPSTGAGFSGPLNRTIQVGGYSIGYRAVQTSAGKIGIGTYWLN